MKTLRLLTLICALSLMSFSSHATSLTLNVSPGELRELLLDAASEPDELILTGTLNSVDLSYINNGSGKISNVTVLDLSQIRLDYDEGVYSSGNDAWVEHSGIMQSRVFLLSNNPRIEVKSTTNNLGQMSATFYEFSNNLAGLFINNQTLRKVVLPTYISQFGDFICASSAIEEIVFPSSTTQISNYAFTKSNIKKLTIDNINGIGRSAFKNSKIESLDFSNIRNIGEQAFYMASSLSGKISLSNLIEVPDYCFEGTALEEVNIGKGISRIGIKAFASINSLTNVSLAEGVESIDDYAFTNASYNCNVKSFNVPSSVVEIGVDALPSCWVDSQPKEDNVVYIGTIAYKFIFENNNVTTLRIKDGTKKISNGFTSGLVRAQKVYLKEIYLPASITSIGNNAFEDFTGVENVTFANNSQLERIGYRGFNYCTSLSQINLPESLKYIGDNCFNYCTSMGEVNLPSGLEYVGKEAFYVTPSKIKNFPSSIEYIGEFAFASRVVNTGAENFYITLPSNITLGKDLRFIGQKAFANGLGVYNLTVECDSIEDCAQNIFTGCGIEKITIKNNVRWLPHGMFDGLTSLSRLEFEESNDPEASLKIGWACFRGCPSVKFSEFPSQLKEIGDYAFAKSQLPKFLSTKNIHTIGSEAFSECTNLESLEITNSLKNKGNYIFEKIESLKNVYYNAKSIEEGSSMFYGYPTKDPIESVVIGKDVEIVPSNCFANLITLKSITFEKRDGGTPLKINANAFASSLGYDQIWLPDGVTEIGSKAFYGTYLVRLHIGKGLKTIGDNAFDRTLLGLVNPGIDLPATVESIGDQAIPNNIYRLYCHSANPPKFKGAVASNIIFHVPEQYMGRYQEAFPNNNIVSYAGSEFSITGGQVEVGHSYTLTPKFEFNDLFDLNLTWESDNPEVIKVTDSFFDANVEVLGEGSATITARYLHHDGQSKTCELYTEGYSSLPSLEINQDNIWISGGKIVMNGLTPGSVVTLYSVDGKLIYSGRADSSGCVETPVQSKGVYVLRIDQQGFKIVV